MAENEQGKLQWLFRLRLLFVIFLMVIPIAIWERSAATSDDESAPYGLSESRISDDPELTSNVADVSFDLYPDRMLPHYWKGFHAFQGAQYKDARRHFQAAININPKDEALLYTYAVTLSIIDEESPESKMAINAWKWNYPHSQRSDPVEAARSMRYFPRGIKALEAKEFAKAAKYFEQDLRSVRITEELLYHYAVALVLSSDDENHIQAAIDAWNASFPNSTRDDPQTGAERWR